MNITQNQLYQYLVDLAVVLLVGLAQYLNLVPAGTLYPILLLVVGRIVGTLTTVASANATQANTVATQANTQAMAPLPTSIINDRGIVS
jgi:hypothetical protein